MAFLRTYFTLERILIICTACLLYGITLKAGYSIDDSFVTKEGNITTRGLRAIPEIIASNYATDDSGQSFDYRPVVKISFAIEHQFFGVSALGSHFFNFFIFIICLLLMYRLLRLVVADPKSRLPLYTVVLFALLPIHTEVVASIKNRDILLSFLFFLLAAITLYAAELKQKRIWLSYLLGALFIYLGMLAKFDAVTGLATIPALLFLKLKPLTRRRILIVLALLAGIVASRMMSRNITDNGIGRPYSYFENPLYFEKGFMHRIVALFNSFGFYITQCIFPFKQACYYGVESVTITSLSGYGWLGIFSSAAILFAMIRAFFKKNFVLLWGLIAFVAGISMFLNFVKPAVGIVADRFAFFGSFGFCISVIFLLKPYLWKPAKPVFLKAIALILFGTYSYMTIARNLEWRNPAIMIAADLKKYPNSSYLNYLYATAVMDSLVSKKDAIPPQVKQEKIAIIKKHLEKSIRVSNDYPKAYDFISSVMVFLTKEYKEALPYIDRGLRLHKNPDLYYYKGMCLRGLGMPDSAERYLKLAIKADPNIVSAYNLLMQDYNAAGQYQKSIDLLNGALEKGMENEFTYLGLAATYLEMKDTSSVEFYCQKALEMNPSSEKALQLLDKLK